MARNRWLSTIAVSTLPSRAGARRTGRLVPFLVAALLATAGLTASPVSAFAPERFGPTTYDYTFIGFSCDRFDIEIAGAGTDWDTVFFDGSGEFVKDVYFARFPHDVMTNTVTGRSIVVQGDFQIFVDRVPGTDEFVKTVVGHRYLVNEPGVGVTIRDVGRITYADLEETIVSRQAGEHDLAFDDQLQPTFCAALA